MSVGSLTQWDQPHPGNEFSFKKLNEGGLCLELDGNQVKKTQTFLVGSGGGECVCDQALG